MLIDLVTTGWLDLSALNLLQTYQMITFDLAKSSFITLFGERRLIYDESQEAFIYMYDSCGAALC